MKPSDASPPTASDQEGPARSRQRGIWGRIQANALGILQVAALMLGLVVVVEFAVLAQCADYPLAALGPGLAYITLVWTLLRKKEESWENKLFGWAVRGLLSTKARTATTVFALASAAAALGVAIQRCEATPNYFVWVLDRGKPIENVEIRLFHLTGRLDHALVQSSVTNPEGGVGFCVEKSGSYRGELIRSSLNQKARRASLTGGRIAPGETTYVYLDQIPDSSWDDSVTTELKASIASETFWSRISILSKHRDDLARTSKQDIERHLPFGSLVAPIVTSRSEYTVGYDPARKTPLWVAYKIKLGDPLRRAEAFVADPSLPKENQPDGHAYVHSGFDRGHLVASHDIAGYGGNASAAINMYSVIVPQHPDCNRFAWLALETYGEKLAATDEVWVVAGPVYTSLGGAPLKTIGDGILVPPFLFRVLVEKTADGGLSAAGFLIPNSPVGRDRHFERFTVPLRRIEELTGLKFFSALPDAERNRLISTVTQPKVD